MRACGGALSRRLPSRPVAEPRGHSPSTVSRLPAPKVRTAEAEHSPGAPHRNPGRAARAAHPAPAAACRSRSTASPRHGPRAPHKNPRAACPAYLAPSAGCPSRNTACLCSQHRGPGQKLCRCPGLGQAPSHPGRPIAPPAPGTRSPRPRCRPPLSTAQNGAGPLPPFSIPPQTHSRTPSCAPLPSTVSLEPGPKCSSAVFTQLWGPRRKPRLPRRWALGVQRSLPEARRSWGHPS